VLLSCTGEGLRERQSPSLARGVRLAPFKELKTLQRGEQQAIVLISPSQESQYKAGVDAGKRLGIPVIVLNAPYSFRYDIGGGKPYELVYVMKRIPKGWIFRLAPKDFQVYRYVYSVRKQFGRFSL
jgi:hypothetical protein